MLFAIIEDFGVRDGESWSNYIKWRGIAFDRFDSLDGMLRKKLFTSPETDEDWNHVVCESFMVCYLTNLRYAQKVHARIGVGSLVGFKSSEHDERHKGFLGYDIIDPCYDASLLTNWGNDIEIINRLLASNALVRNLNDVERIHDFLTSNHGDDSHVNGCRIISVYSLLPH